MTRRDRSKVLVIGQGYVGLPLAMRAADAGHDVVGYEVDGGRVKRLQAAETYVEDVSSAMLVAALATGRHLPTSDPQQAVANSARAGLRGMPAGLAG